ncbi:unnamed protein product [Angiostrongylus costaricensis]|uniref:Nanos-type domain-containing protein n=1 Tax=Angiostrongylus costaricensis TaxID=334426 RepID=A0A158PML7_ANGCS|nr:unnamed protein product [Angiostrongylus costaricensis]
MKQQKSDDGKFPKKIQSISLLGLHLLGCHQAAMYGKTVLESKPERLRQNVGMFGSKNGKLELELKKITNDENGENRNPIFTDCWQESLDLNLNEVLRACEDRKELLQYRGKLPRDGWCNGESSKNPSGSGQLVFQIDRNVEIENVIQSPQMEIRPPDQLAPGSMPPDEVQRHVSVIGKDRPPTMNFPPFKKEPVCWYCYDKYTEMCLAQGRNPPSLHSFRVIDGRFSCPHLWFTKCERCGATAADAHTDSYCPMFTFSNLRVDST